jgi:hypothetical protein
VKEAVRKNVIDKHLLIVQNNKSVLWGTLKEGHMHPAPSEKHPSKILMDKSKGAGKRAISEPHGKHRDVQRLRGAIRDKGAGKTQI